MWQRLASSSAPSAPLAPGPQLRGSCGYGLCRPASSASRPVASTSASLAPASPHRTASEAAPSRLADAPKPVDASAQPAPARPANGAEARTRTGPHSSQAPRDRSAPSQPATPVTSPQHSQGAPPRREPLTVLVPTLPSIPAPVQRISMPPSTPVQHPGWAPNGPAEHQTQRPQPGAASGGAQPGPHSQQAAAAGQATTTPISPGGAAPRQVSTTSTPGQPPPRAEGMPRPPVQPSFGWSSMTPTPHAPTPRRPHLTPAGPIMPDSSATRSSSHPGLVQAANALGPKAVHTGRSFYPSTPVTPPSSHLTAQRSLVPPPQPPIRSSGSILQTTTHSAPVLPPPELPLEQGHRRPGFSSLKALKPKMPAAPSPDLLARRRPSFVKSDGEVKNAATANKGSRKLRTEKQTAEMRRRAREQRIATREEKAAQNRREREEIFDVGDEGMSLEVLAELIQVEPSEVVRALFMKGIMLSMNQVLDKNTCKLVAAEYGLLVVDKDSTSAAKKKAEYTTEEDIDDLTSRPPVVTVMGHVDHGKTSLLDFIRKARVAAGEAGGITQRIGAYNTTLEVDGEQRTICFLDTPGHEAFSAMRARGAMVTDIAIIIVAADDGVRPQTKEAVAHAQAAEVPIIVAINKCDKPGADPERVKQELLELNLVPEEWGGTTPMVNVSAKKGTGIPELLTQVLWLAEEKQLVSNPKRPACGTVIEAYLDKRSGPVATLLVQAGTLRPGDVVCAGATHGRVRTLLDDRGKPLESAGPSIACQLVGLSAVPLAGEEFQVFKTDGEARHAAEREEEKRKQQRLSEMASNSTVTLSTLATVEDQAEALQRLNLIVRADTSGMVEAIKSALAQLPQSSISLRFLLASAGQITESDVDLAAASQALILGFNVWPNETVEAAAKSHGVKIMPYKVIYDLVDDVKTAMEGKLKAVQERLALGRAEVKAVFGSGKKKVAGCAVVQGKLQKGALVTVTRGKNVVFDGQLTSLRRVKDAVEEVNEGLECGVGAEGFLDWVAGDVMECYQMVTKYRRLEEAKAATAVDVSTLG